MPDVRSVRVFVSSTFRDFAEERDELATHAWPALRALCEERAVTFTDVDLPWGITNEQAAEGRVLPICLAEIDASRPYFIGILGERYGWVPEAIPDELVETMPWLAEHKTESVTDRCGQDVEVTDRMCRYISGSVQASRPRGFNGALTDERAGTGGRSRIRRPVFRPRAGRASRSIGLD